jgi:hypothetical protein
MDILSNTDRRQMRTLHTLSIAIVLLLAAAGFASAQQPFTRTSGSIGKLLNPDGTINLSTGFSGTLDSHGWRMEIDSGGTPRFIPDGSSAHGSSSLPVPGDEGWDDRFGPPGANGNVYAIAVRGRELFVGGRFTAIGNAVARNIARWNSMTKDWSEIGGGLGRDVHVITIGDSGEVYAGGYFAASGNNGFVARWDTVNNIFTFLGKQGVIGSSANTNGAPTADVTAIAASGDDLYVGGWFQQVDNIPVTNIARWNRRTNRWSAMPGAVPGTIAAIAIRGKDVYVGGTGGIAVWDTTTKKWSKLGSGVAGSVSTIVIRGNDLYAGGGFVFADDLPVRYIARWDGTRWSSVGAGVGGPVRSMVFIGNDLYVGGTFLTAANAGANYVARWDGGNWSALGLGLGGSTSPFAATLATDGTILYAGGGFTAAGNITAHNIAGWDGVQWFPLVKSGGPDLNRNGTNGPVFAVAVDGEDLYVGGDFTRAGGVDASHVARWNAVSGSWSALGSGIGGEGAFVRSLAVKDGSLYVGGIFTRAGGAPATGIARWNGSNWSALGGGVGGTTPYVFAMTFAGNDLYVGGAFTTAGGVTANRIARWDGSNWSALGNGIQGDPTYSYVTSIALVGSDLYAGGNFIRVGSVTASYIARWDGTAWSTLQGGTNAPVAALASDGTSLYVGGEFTLAGGVAVNHIARWSSGSWSPLGSGTNAPVRALLFRNGILHAGGEFTAADTARASHLARWDGTAWSYLGSRVDNGVNGPVRSIALLGTDIYIGGEFSTAGERRANNIAGFDGKEWSSLGSDPGVGLLGPVLAIAVDGTDIYVGGLFSSAGGMTTSGIARWDGSTWHRLGTGVNGPVRSIAIGKSGEVYVGGEFTAAGGSPAAGIAMWDGSIWHPLGSGLGGPKPYGFSLAVAGNDLYVGGSFSSAGGVPSSRIARWSIPSRSWSPVGSGVHGSSFYTYVTTLAVHGGDLYIGGVFTNVGGVDAGNIARWDGSNWSALGQGVNNAVYAIATGKNGDLYAGGDMTASGDSSVGNVVRWDGSQWVHLAQGTGGTIYAMAVSDNGTLVTGGDFSYAGAVPTNHIGRWEGTNWLTMGRGVDNDFSRGVVYAVAIGGNDIYVGGEFTVAGGKPSLYFARWGGAYLSVETERPVRSASTLAGNYPNPFSTTTTIRFSVGPHRSQQGISAGEKVRVRLAIYDPTGRAVASLLDGELSAGEHSVEFDASDLPAGIYFCRLQMEGRSETCTLLVRR